LPGALAKRKEATFIALPHIFENRVELGALGGFRRTDYGDNEQPGFHIPRH
jgi:hypothetical protein